MQKTKQLLVTSVLILGLVMRVRLLVSPLTALIKIVPDDAFYYLQTASNIVGGKGSTFDGIHMTNGYHPLWMILILPIAALVKEPVSYLRMVLLLGMALSSLSALLVYRILRAMTDHWWIQVLGMAGYYLLKPTVVSSLNGLETSLTTLLFMLLLYLIVCEAKGGKRTKGYDTALGLLLGFLFLARTDSVFYIVAFFLCPVAQQEKALRWRRALVLIVGAAIVVSPWLVWNWVNFGTPLQSSGLAVPYVLHESFRLQGHSNVNMLVESAHQLVSQLFSLWEQLGLSLFAFLVFGWHWQGLLPTSRRFVRILIALWAAGMVLMFVHAFVRWYPRAWYSDQSLALSMILFYYSLAFVNFEPLLNRIKQGDPLQSWFGARAGRLALAGAVLCFLLLQTVYGVWGVGGGYYPQQVEMLDAAYWLRDNTAQGEVAAAFNAGVMSFFSGRQVVNLDGAINNAAYDAIKRGDLVGLMKRASVDHYLDYDPAMLDLYAPFMGNLQSEVDMSAVGVIDDPAIQFVNSRIVVYELKWLARGS